LRDVRDFQMAEDCLQEATGIGAVALVAQRAAHSGAGWVLQAARRKAIDRFRRARNFDRKAEEYGLLIELDQQTVDPRGAAGDTRRALAPDLHLLPSGAGQQDPCRLDPENAVRADDPGDRPAFLDATEAMAQRLVRARHKITKAGIPFAIPEPEHWAERLNSVLSVIYLIFNEGYTATAGPELLRQDLCLEAIRLGRLMLELAPGDAECEGLLALMLLNHSRARARIDDQGRMIPLDQQDRSLWRNGEIEEGSRILERALARGRAGLFQLQAAISALHAEAASHAETDWQQIVLLYEAMHARSDNPVYLLNRAAALSYAHGADQALDALGAVEAALDGYQPFHAAKADLLRRTGQFEAARQSYRRAIALSGNESERQFLASRMAAIDQST
jgi:RNA polymerase sigma-70 factor (ECF subfamily)